MFGYVDIYVWFKNSFLDIIAIYVCTDKSVFLEHKFEKNIFYD